MIIRNEVKSRLDATLRSLNSKAGSGSAQPGTAQSSLDVVELKVGTVTSCVFGIS